MSKDSFSLKNETKKRIRAPILKAIRNAVLPKKYRLSVVLIGKKISRKLNLTYRNINKATNVLSFPLSKEAGEIFLDLETIKSEEKKFGRNFNNLLHFLFIHALFHLKGYQHGVTMEKREAAVRRKFKI